MTKRNEFAIVARLALGLFGLALLASNVQAQIRPKILASGVENPASALWAGNSFFYYNNSMHGHVTQLLASADPAYKFRQASVTIGGSGFDWHDMESYFRPNAIGSYSFDANNNVVFNKLDRLFDVAIMMDCSQCPVHPKLQPVFYEYVAKHSATVRKYGAEPVLFMSWAYQDKPEMTQQLATEYIKAGKAVNANVVPAGLAFAKSIELKPDINLYAADKRHPSLAGTYLSACTVMASVYKQNPIGNKYSAGLPEDIARHLQTVAWETVQSFKM